MEPTIPSQDSVKPEATEPKQEPSVMTEETVRKLIQSETDKVRTKYSQELKEKQDTIESLQKEKMTAAQLREYEQKQLTERLAAKEKELNDKEVSIHARDKLVAEGLDISFVEFVKADTKEKTEERIKILKTKINDYLKTSMDDKLKEHGRDPQKGRDQVTQPAILGMTPAQIQQKSRADPEWFRKNESEILAAVAAGTIKK